MITLLSPPFINTARSFSFPVLISRETKHKIISFFHVFWAERHALKFADVEDMQSKENEIRFYCLLHLIEIYGKHVCISFLAMTEKQWQIIPVQEAELDSIHSWLLNIHREYQLHIYPYAKTSLFPFLYKQMQQKL